MRTQKDWHDNLPLYGIYLLALVAIYLLYDNQFNKRLEGAIGTTLPFSSVGDRGTIFLTDKEGRKHLVASTHFGYNLNISPLELGDAEEIYEHLNEEISIEREQFFASATKNTSDEYESIKKDIPESLKLRLEQRIERYGLKGVWLEPFKKRIYPHDSLAAHVIGFVATDENDVTKGQYGIENIFDSVLSIANKTVKGTGTRIIEEVEGVNTADSYSAGNVVLTVDIEVQAELEEQLKNIQRSWSAEKVGGIILDPNTGAVRAMAAVPTFNPNTFNKVENYAIFNNPNLQDVYEMGSVFKALTVAIALDSGKVSPFDTYTDSGSVVIEGRTISNYDGRGRGRNVGIQTILSQSLNTGAIFLQQKTGSALYKGYFDAFRFDDVTRIDLPKEVPGLVDNLRTGGEVEFATASYGHGIAVTPISTVRAFAAIANGGFIIEPYVVEEIQHPRRGGIITGVENRFERERKRVFSRETTEQTTEYLVRAYDRGVLGGTLRNPRYTIAAKTGTAQLVNPETGKYAEGKFLHSFFGYFPADNPRYIVFLFAVNPKAEFASTTLAKPFSMLTNFLIEYYAIPPNR